MNNVIIDHETKKVLRGYCIKPIHSVNLDKETLYYLEPHGLGCYFVSRFPSGKRSHMGVYQKDRFHIIREEVVTILNTDENISKRESEIEINADVKEKKKESVEKNLKRVAKEKYLVWDDLKCGVIYKADLVYDPNGNTLPGPVQQYYVLKIAKGQPYYNELSCNYYEDIELSILKGGCSVKRFENFLEVGPAPLTKKTTGNKQTLSNGKVKKHENKSVNINVLVDNNVVNSAGPVTNKPVIEELKVLENTTIDTEILSSAKGEKIKDKKSKSKKKEVSGEQITLDLF
ncbi:hypothetical protein [Lysinibacillus fusiformis]|uniref:hypothetical protein n=1 Tax=Lysinibacillus fusiformis TaxID=28031 RepID=UPI001880BCD8|nr:hypothetical protein [Lysinibacillus fusiformis]MBD8523895.1 hypothetical protein [Lysinibacillus fusiformis]